MKKLQLFVLSIFASFILAPATLADHDWNGYHWARTANPFTLKLGDNVSSVWDGNLAVASSDWSTSSVLDTTVVSGSTNPKNCKPVQGRIEVCNSKYGKNGWLGIAQIWVTGDHIYKGAVKMNDTYFNTAQYNTNAWRQLVVCQEVAHAFGLDHQDEDFNNANLGSCMDYTNNPSTNQHPNAHDFEELETIYAHLDSTTTVGQTAPQNSPQGDGSDWGREARRHGHESVFVKDLGRGHKIVTHVFWS